MVAGYHPAARIVLCSTLGERLGATSHSRMRSHTSNPCPMRIPSIPGIAFLQDDDCHWYFCPASKVQEAEDHLEAEYLYWVRRPYEEDPRLLPPKAPSWLRIVGGSPDLITKDTPEVLALQKGFPL